MPRVKTSPHAKFSSEPSLLCVLWTGLRDGTSKGKRALSPVTSSHKATAVNSRRFYNRLFFIVAPLSRIPLMTLQNFWRTISFSHTFLFLLHQGGCREHSPYMSLGRAWALSPLEFPWCSLLTRFSRWRFGTHGFLHYITITYRCSRGDWDMYASLKVTQHIAVLAASAASGLHASTVAGASIGAVKTCLMSKAREHIFFWLSWRKGLLTKFKSLSFRELFSHCPRQGDLKLADITTI